MKPLVIVGLWAAAGWDVGAWAQTFVGIPGVVGIVAGVAIGVVLAVEVRRRMNAGAARVPQAVDIGSVESASALEQAA